MALFDRVYSSDPETSARGGNDLCRMFTWMTLIEGTRQERIRTMIWIKGMVRKVLKRYELNPVEFLTSG
jgi:hypothetical protein